MRQCAARLARAHPRAARGGGIAHKGARMRDARTLTIVKAVVDMARSLGIAVTAEGIETQAQQTWMQHLGCDSAQGFLFSRPLAADDFLRQFLDRRSALRERSLLH